MLIYLYTIYNISILHNILTILSGKNSGITGLIFSLTIFKYIHLKQLKYLNY